MSDNLTTEVVEDQADAPAEQAPVPKKNRRQLLEREGEVAADFLETLLDIADLDGDIDMDVENDRASVSIVGGALDHLVGRNGEVLEASARPWYVTTLQLSEPLHFGDYGGLPLKVLWALLDILTIVVLGSGLYLWLKRGATEVRT